MLIFDLFGPVLETTCYLAIIFGIVTGTLSPSVEIFFFFSSILYGTLISLGAMLIHEFFYPTYKTVRDVFLLIASSIVENFGYRQVITAWRLFGVIGHFRGTHSWGAMKRSGFQAKP
jgi:hypothetical protein